MYCIDPFTLEYSMLHVQYTCYHMSIPHFQQPVSKWNGLAVSHCFFISLFREENCWQEPWTQQQLLFYGPYPGIPRWLGTFTHSHLSLSSTILSTTVIWLPICLFDSLCAQPLFKSSLVYLWVWEPALHTPYMIHLFTQSLSSFCNACLYHRNLFSCSTKIMQGERGGDLIPVRPRCPPGHYWIWAAH